MSSGHSHRTPPGTPETAPRDDKGARGVWRFEEDEALRLLASAPLGRVVFTERAMPAIRPVNHFVDEDGCVIIRTHLGAAALTALGEVVAYEADAIDPHTRLGWSVIVTGVARRVSDPEQITRYEQLVRPWVGTEMDQVIRIKPELVTGYALVAGRGNHDDRRRGAEHP